MDHSQEVDNAGFLSGIGRVEFVPTKWGQAVIDDLSRITSGIGIETDFTREMAAYAALIEADQAQLLAMELDGENVGHVLWSVDHQPDGFDLVVNAASIRPLQGFDATRAMFAAFEALGRASGARALRCFTRRAGLVRKLERIKGASVSYVVELALNGQ